MDEIPSIVLTITQIVVAAVAIAGLVLGILNRRDLRRASEPRLDVMLFPSLSRPPVLHFDRPNPMTESIKVRVANVGQLRVSVESLDLELTDDSLGTIDGLSWGGKTIPRILEPAESIEREISRESLRRLGFKPSDDSRLFAVVRDHAGTAYRSQPRTIAELIQGEPENTP